MIRGPSGVWLRRIALLPLLTISALVAPPNVGSPAQRPPLVGFSFTPNAARYAGLAPIPALRSLLTRIQPDLVRLPVYWEDSAPTPDRLDFTVTDQLLDVVRAHNRSASRTVRVILVEGARNLGYPELFVPGWVTEHDQRDVPAVLQTEAYQRYMTATLLRYRDDPLLYAWQVENEPFDNVVSGAPGAVRVPAATLGGEVAQARRQDPAHPVVVSSYNSATLDLDEMALSPFARLFADTPLPHATGHPEDALNAGDVLGLDVYVSTPSTKPQNAEGNDGSVNLTVAKRARWKRDVLDYWGERAGARGKQMWIMEMQGGSWPGDTSFKPHDLAASAGEYSDGAASVILLWGVESWLITPEWMNTGVIAVSVMRGGDPNGTIRS